MEFSFERSQFGSTIGLEFVLQQDATGLELVLQDHIRTGTLERIELSVSEDFIVTDFYEAFADDLRIVDITRKAIAVRAAKFAKLTYGAALNTGPLELFTCSETDGEDEEMNLLADLHGQSATFYRTHPETVRFVERFNVELDPMGENTGFAVQVALLALAAVESNQQTQAFNANIDDELALHFGEAS